MSLSTEDKELLATIIKETVNGKIKRVEDKLDEHMINHAEFMEVLRPVADAVVWVDSTRKFLLYVGGIVGTITAILALIKFK